MISILLLVFIAAFILMRALFFLVKKCPMMLWHTSRQKTTHTELFAFSPFYSPSKEIDRKAFRALTKRCNLRLFSIATSLLWPSPPLGFKSDAVFPNSSSSKDGIPVASLPLLLLLLVLPVLRRRRNNHKRGRTAWGHLRKTSKNDGERNVTKD